MKEIQSELAELSQKYEKEYQNRAQGLQNEISDFQRQLRIDCGAR